MQRAYLEAMEIPVWVRKELAGQVPDFVSPALRLGPGSGHVLLICAAVDEPASRIAADIARSLKSEPVWAWPVPDEGTGNIIATVQEHLFTTVILFGEPLAKQVFNGAAPEALGSARLLVAPCLEEVAVSPAARQTLWKLICKAHPTGRSGSPAG